jgi:hypothetical protein
MGTCGSGNPDNRWQGGKLKKCVLIAIFLLICGGLWAQLDLYLYGDSGYLLNLYRVRQDHEAAIPEQEDGDDVDEIERWLFDQLVYLSLSLQYSNVLEVHGDISTPLLWQQAGIVEPSLQQLYLTLLPTDWLSLVLGKQKLQRILQKGVNGLKIVLIPTEWLGLSLLGMPDEELRWFKAAFQCELLIEETEIGFGAIKYNHNHLQDMTISWQEEDFTVQMDDKQYDRLALFLTFINFFGDLGIYSEFEYRYSREREFAFIDDDFDMAAVMTGNPYSYYTRGDGFLDNNIFRITAGLHYLLPQPPYLNVIIEYFYNGEGFTRSQAIDFIDRYQYHMDNYAHLPFTLPPALNRFGSLRQHYLFFGLTDINATDYITLSLSSLANLESLALILVPEISIQINEIIFMNLKYEWLHQFLDKEEEPSDLYFVPMDHRFSLGVNTSF